MRDAGWISSMQHFSTGDGPGIRTTVFFAGCNLRCQWCHNPEAIAVKPTLMYYANLCVSCGLCVKACPKGAHTLSAAGHAFNRSGCSSCGLCADICPAGALAMSAKRMTCSEVMDFILEDQDFYLESGGGVTLSGGEPLLQADFAADIARACRERGVHVILDTAGNVPFDAFEKVIPYVDAFYFDLKCATGEDYRQYTGGSLDISISRMRELTRRGCPVTARIPVIPGVNDSRRHCAAFARILREAGVREATLLPFHRMGGGKYAALGLEYPCALLTPPKKEGLIALSNAFGPGLRVTIAD